MINQRPTDEQIKELWEWCGIAEPDIFINKPFSKVTPLDFNNLFKYAVPRLKQEYRNWKSVLHDWIDKLTGDPEKDTIGLYQILCDHLEIRQSGR